MHLILLVCRIISVNSCDSVWVYFPLEFGIYRGVLLWTMVASDRRFGYMQQCSHGIPTIM